MTNRIDDALSFQSKALGLRAYRQQILAGNIANADTPNYKARDFDFSAALQDAVAGRSEGDLPLATTAPGHIQGAGGSSGPVRLMYRTLPQDAVDGNTVDMDIERSAFSENAIQYQAGLTFITHELKMMMSALQG
ncbi:MAG: flagellar basal body rod protein FlgB [Propionivibrio sp.]